MKDTYHRPDPDQLLAALQSENAEAKRGKLKIFLGYVAGVGKTYAMLEAAHQRKAEGMDVVVAYVETHGRAETENLLQGLEVLPRQQVEYHGTQLTDMDLDRVLSRQPQLVLVDELAHTNAPGLRHPKRFQDVEEILSTGIDVYTTVNIQHLESLNDIVYQITGVRVSETIPDRVFDEAYEIELVDLPSDELIQRLKDGKVYVPEQAARAIEKFFRKGNLTALREMAMRRAAERVDTQMRTYMQSRAIPGPWAAGERILVSISSHPLGERLIRAGRRLADDLNANWFVLFVETPGHLTMPPENRARIEHNLLLAENLGAHTFIVSGNSVADEIVNFCQKHNITKIVAGRPYRNRIQEFFKPSIIGQILRKSGRVDVYIISEDQVTLHPVRIRRWHLRPSVRRYALSIIIVGIATLINMMIHPYLDPINLVMIYLAGVVIVAVFLGRGPSMLASFLSVFVFDFILVEPRFSFAISDTQYLITFLGLLLVGLIISNSASLLRDQVETLRKRDNQTQALNRFSQALTGAVTLEEVLNIVQENINDVFTRESMILLPEKGKLVPKASTSGFVLSDEELAVAEWSFKNGMPAGHGTDTLSAAEVRYVPLKTSRGVIGILGIKPQEQNSFLSPDQRELLISFASLSALAIERARFAEDALQTETLRTAERLQSALLNSISHQFRTPLATITGVLTSLDLSENDREGQNQLDASTRITLIKSATDQAQQLNRLVENLLDMTRLEAGAIHLFQETSDLQDLIGAVIHQMTDILGNRHVDIRLPVDLPNVWIDLALTGQVLINLLENACKYSPSDTPITISAQSWANQVAVLVSDQGIGIPEDDLERVFDKFYRVNHPNQVTGTGLGLSICRGIIEAQGGKIWAQNNPNLGVTITFTLPVLPAVQKEAEVHERREA